MKTWENTVNCKELITVKGITIEKQGFTDLEVTHSQSQTSQAPSLSCFQYFEQCSSLRTLLLVNSAGLK